MKIVEQLENDIPVFLVLPIPPDAQEQLDIAMANREKSLAIHHERQRVKRSDPNNAQLLYSLAEAIDLRDRITDNSTRLARRLTLAKSAKLILG